MRKFQIRCFYCGTLKEDMDFKLFYSVKHQAKNIETAINDAYKAFKIPRSKFLTAESV